MRQSLTRAAQLIFTVLLACAAVIALLPPAAPIEPAASLASPIGRLAQASPELGPATADPECIDADHCWQNFEHALVTWTPETGAHAIVEGSILSLYESRGGPRGEYGFARQHMRTHSGGTSQHFTGGGIFTAGEHTIEVSGAVWEVYAANHAEDGPLGYPVTSVYLDDGTVPTQRFGDGLIQVDTDPIPIWGEIAQHYLSNWGGVAGELGLATSQPRQFPRGDGFGLAQTFEKGDAFSTTDNGTHIVTPPMLEAYTTRGLEVSDLGPPRAQAVNVTGGIAQDFAGGTAYLKTETGAMFAMMYGDIRNRYNELGGVDSTLGFPISERTPHGELFFQRFDHGALVWIPEVGALAIDQVAFDDWLSRGAALGNPVQDSWTDDRGVHTKFERGEVITANGRLYSADPVGPDTAVIICDSQCTPDNSWLNIGAADAGFTSVIKRGYAGAGYGVAPPALTTSVSDAVLGNEVMLPAGDPGVVILSLGGNDATVGLSDDKIRADAERLITRVMQLYPNTPLVVNGVLSRDDAGHARRRQVDKIVTDVARSLGVRTISLAGWGTKYSLQFYDNVHLTAQGHADMGRAYGPSLRGVLGR